MQHKLSILIAMTTLILFAGCDSGTANPSKKSNSAEILNLTAEELSARFGETKIGVVEIESKGFPQDFKIRLALSKSQLYVLSMLSTDGSIAQTYFIEADSNKVFKSNLAILFSSHTIVESKHSLEGHWDDLNTYMDRFHFDSVFRCRTTKSAKHYSSLTPKRSGWVTLKTNIGFQELQNYIHLHGNDKRLWPEVGYEPYLSINYTQPSQMKLGVIADRLSKMEPVYSSVSRQESLVGETNTWLDEMDNFKSECDKIYERHLNTFNRVPFDESLDQEASELMDEAFSGQKTIPLVQSNYLNGSVSPADARRSAHSFDTIPTESEYEKYKQRVRNSGGLL